jgi:molybdate transport system permease protein
VSDRRERESSRLAAGEGLLHALAFALLLFLFLPFLGLVATSSWRDFVAGLAHPLVWPALRLSIVTTMTSLFVVVLFGTPLAWLLARRRGRVARAIETAIQLPVVIPPAVAGLALLLAFGRRGVVGSALYPEGFSVAFTTPAVVIAEVFVSAPFFVQSATSAFRRIDENLVIVARSFGASPLRLFFRLGLPLSAAGLVSGAAMSWARALGEFGATLMFAGNLTGETQTLPLAIYTALESDLRAAQALSLVLVAVAFALLVGVRASVAGASSGASRGAPT